MNFLRYIMERTFPISIGSDTQSIFIMDPYSCSVCLICFTRFFIEVPETSLSVILLANVQSVVMYPFIMHIRLFYVVFGFLHTDQYMRSMFVFDVFWSQHSFYDSENYPFLLTPWQSDIRVDYGIKLRVNNTCKTPNFQIFKYKNKCSN